MSEIDVARMKGGWWIRWCALVLCAALLPRALSGRDARSLWQGGDRQLEFARGVASAAAEPSFHTGSRRFDGEWAFGTCMMATLGLGQIALAQRAQRAALLPAMERNVARLVSDETNAFGTEAWGGVGLRELAHGAGHGYLGYSNLALAMLRLVQEDTRYRALGDQLTEALASRLAAAPHAIFETYPGEAYPPDMALVAGSIALHDCAAGLPERAWLPAWRRAFVSYIDPASGLLYQAANADTGVPLGSPRGSGTAIAAYALSFANVELSRRLYAGLHANALDVLGFGMVREYPAGVAGEGDIDSGPVLFGVGVSATGFTLAAARLYGDERLFTELYRTVDLVGVPLADAGGRHFMSGGPLGNAIMLAMTSASFDWSQHCRRHAS